MAPDTSPTETKSTATPTGRQTARPSGWPYYLALALAAIAVILAGLAYFHPAHTGGTAVAQQDGDAKTNMCAAFGTVRKAVVLNTHLQAPNDPMAQLSVAANARLALLGGGEYLRNRLAANTAAPADLTSGLRTLADTVEQIGIGYLAGASPTDLAPLRDNLNKNLDQITKLCS